MLARIQNIKDQGLFASKPGYAWDDANPKNLLISPVFDCLQLAANGEIADPGNNATVTLNYPDMGAVPYVWLASGRYKLTVPKNTRTATSCQIKTEDLQINWGSHVPDGRILWAIIPMRWPA